MFTRETIKQNKKNWIYQKIFVSLQVIFVQVEKSQ